jgi:phosphoribosylglycinamide formyltransferase-1
MVPVVILISGRGSNMVAIAQAAHAGRLPVRVAAVISNRDDSAGLIRAQAMGIPTAIVTREQHLDRDAYDRALAEAVRGHSPGIVVLAGFMRILGAQFVREFSGRLLNIHPSLLPAYRGLHTHRRALEAGDTEHGCSVHFVTEELDGGPVIVQARVPVLPGDTPDTLSARVQAQEHRIYPEAIEWLATGRLQWNGGDIRFDGQPLRSPQILEAMA